MSLINSPQSDYIGQDVRGCVFKQFDMTGCKFQYARLNGCTFVGCLFSNAHFQGADLTNAAFYMCKFINETNFDNAKLTKTKFEHCIFGPDTSFKHTYLYDTAFTKVNANHADFNHAKRKKSQPIRVFQCNNLKILDDAFIESQIEPPDSSSSSTSPSVARLLDVAEFSSYLDKLSKHNGAYTPLNNELSTEMGLDMMNTVCEKYGIKCSGLYVRIYCQFFGGIMNMEGGRELIEKINACSGEEIVPIYFELKWTNSSGIPASSHANMLFLDTRKNKLYHFEPHGRAMGPDIIQRNQHIRNMNLNIDVFARSLAGLIDSNPVYVSPNEMCPADYGFQVLEERAARKEYVEQEGNCLLWTLFFMDTVLRYPNIHIDNIYQRAFNAVGTNKMHKIMRSYMSDLSW